LNAVTDNDYITSLKATCTDIDIDNYAVRCFVFKFALEPKAQIQEKDQDANKGGVAYPCQLKFLLF
jgi:hypothetical protein